MRKLRQQVFLGLIIALGIYIAFLVVADSQLQLSSANVWEQLAQFAGVLVLPLIGLQVLVMFFRWVEWHYYLGVVGARDKLSLFDSVLIQVAGFTMVVSPGKAGELLKSAVLKVKTGVPVVRSAPIVIAERVVDGLAVIVILVGVLLLADDALALGTYNGIDYDHLSRAIIFTSAGLLVAGLVVVQIKPLADFFLGLLRKMPLVNRFYDPLMHFYESSREIFNLRHVIPMTFVGVGVYLPSVLSLFVVLMGFGLEPSWSLLLKSGFIVGVSSAIGALSFVPNGAGVTELSNVGMLLAFVAPDYPELTPAVAAAAALIQGFFHKWLRVLVGLFVVLIFRRRLFTPEVEATLAHMEQSRSAAPGLQAAGG